MVNQFRKYNSEKLERICMELFWKKTLEKEKIGVLNLIEDEH